MQEILNEVFGIWYLMGAALVFFMQAGFAMVEAGFTRAKNAGNIIMKNLMDFCLGFRVIIVTVANSLGNIRVFELLPKLKTKKYGWCIA